MKTKSIIFFSIFLFLLFFLQSGIIYIIVMIPDIEFVINSFLFSGLVMSFSVSLILLYIGLVSENLDKTQRTILRASALMLNMICLIYIFTVL